MQAIKCTFSDYSEGPGTWYWFCHSSSSAYNKLTSGQNCVQVHVIEHSIAALQSLSFKCLPEAHYIFPHGVYPDYKVSDLPLSPQSRLAVLSAHPPPEPQVSLQLLFATGVSIIGVTTIGIIFRVVILPRSIEQFYALCKHWNCIITFTRGGFGGFSPPDLGTYGAYELCGYTKSLYIDVLHWHTLLSSPPLTGWFAVAKMTVTCWNCYNFCTSVEKCSISHRSPVKMKRFPFAEVTSTSTTVVSIR